MIDDQKDRDETVLTGMLHEHLSEKLDDQLGRSATFFAQQMMREPHSTQQTRTNHWRIIRPWAWTLAAGSLAAAAAVVAFVVMSQRIVPSAHPKIAVNPIVDESPRPIERTVYYRTVDDGTVYLDDDTPARQMRRQQVEQVTWLDKKTGQTSRTESIPKEDVMLVAYNKQ